MAKSNNQGDLEGILPGIIQKAASLASQEVTEAELKASTLTR